MKRYIDFLTESPKPLAIGIVGTRGDVYGKQLDPGQYAVKHTDYWPAAYDLSKHFRVTRDLLVTDDWPTADDFFAIMDWCEREGYNIRRYQPTMHLYPMSVDSFDPRTLKDSYAFPLSYGQMLTEAVDQKTAITKLTNLAKEYYDTFSNGRTIDVEHIFHWEADNPPPQHWNDLVVYRQKVGGVKITNVPVNKLTPTQNGVTVDGVKKFIKQNPSRWNAGDEPVRVVWFRGKFFVMDGHHRCAAAILMGYPTVPCELQPLT